MTVFDLFVLAIVGASVAAGALRGFVRALIASLGLVIGLIVAALACSLARGPLRLALLVPTLYLAAFVWENVMIRTVDALAPMRFIVLGLILVALMILRPNGLLGQRRVEIL